MSEPDASPLVSSSPGSGEPKVNEGGITARDWSFLCFLTALNVLNFVDRQLLASFANYIVPDLNLTDGQFGLLTGLIFVFFYALVGLFAGYLADTVHRPRLVAGGVFLWSFLTAMSGAAKGFVSLAIPRLFIGVGESVLTPASMSMLADRFPLSRLGLATGFYYMGVPLGIGASLLVAGYLGDILGWRACFYLLGGLGLLMAVGLLFVRERPRTGIVKANEESAKTSKNTIKLVVATLRSCPSLGLVMAGGVVFHFILGAQAFDQLWFAQELGFDRADIAKKAGFAAVVFGILGNIFGGMASDAFQRITGQGRPMLLFWLMLLFLPFGIVYRLSDGDSIWFWVGICLAFFQQGALYGPTFSTIQELAPPQLRATFAALYILVLNLIGLGIGVTAAGFSIEWMKAAGWATPYASTLLGFTLLSALAIPIFFFSGVLFKRDVERQAQSA